MPSVFPLDYCRSPQHWPLLRLDMQADTQKTQLGVSTCMPACLMDCLPARLTDWLTVTLVTDSSVLALYSRSLAGSHRILFKAWGASLMRSLPYLPLHYTGTPMAWMGGGSSNELLKGFFGTSPGVLHKDIFSPPFWHDRIFSPSLYPLANLIFFEKRSSRILAPHGLARTCYWEGKFFEKRSSRILAPHGLAPTCYWGGITLECI